MPTYVALLRGVNVGGNTLKMERLRALCDELSFKQPRTYVQSGNVVFNAAASAASVRVTLEKALAGETRLRVTVLVRTLAEIERILASNPFLKRTGIDRAKLHVTFLAEPAKAAALGKLAAIDAGQDELHVDGKEIFLYCPNGYGRSKLSNNRLEQVLGVSATTRNWNTVNKLRELAG